MRAVHGAHASRPQGASWDPRSQCVERAALAAWVGHVAGAANPDPVSHTISWLRDSMQFSTMT